MEKFKLYCYSSVLLLLTLFFAQSSALWWPKRRRSCTKTNCRVSSWNTWSACTVTCGAFGQRERTRYKTSSASCGGTCPKLREVQPFCNSQCCPIPCVYKFTAWGPCDSCTRLQKRTQVIDSKEQCGGGCPSPKTEIRQCKPTSCCPVNCVVGAWGSWSTCNAACEKSGSRTRTRKLTPPVCNGKACPGSTAYQACNGPCCLRDCQFSNWSSWGKCTAPTGVCTTNGGTIQRTRTITKKESCGGKCGNTQETKKCTPTPIVCQLSNWGSWSSCQASNGKCGTGTKTRQRKITKQPYCSAKCSKLTDVQPCLHSCCPVNCVYSAWGAWTDCSNQCGTGSMQRVRKIATIGSCSGINCRQDQLKGVSVCKKFVNVDCKLSLWSSWSVCSAGCGKGTKQRTRTIIQQSKCNGVKCANNLETASCTSYRDKANCQVGKWSVWGPCSSKCSVGRSRRVRSILKNPVCGGNICPSLDDTKPCGTINGGCHQSCFMGKCGCIAGYVPTNSTHCIGKNCGYLRFNNCKASQGDACKNPQVWCTSGTLFPVTCYLSCPNAYTLVGMPGGSASVSCQTSGIWPPVKGYCVRNNKPPTDIVLSQNSFKENEAPGFVVGSLTTSDANAKDVHTYRIISDQCRCFSILKNNLKTLKTFDYENMPTRYQITIESTDNGFPKLSYKKTIEVRINDVNERPSNIILSNNVIDENSDEDVVIGTFQTIDVDKNQKFLYQMLDSAGGLFKLSGNKLLTARMTCLSNETYNCPLNFEKYPTQKIMISVSDNGIPVLSIAKQFTIQLKDINDPPYNITLSSNEVKENAPKDTLIGSVAAQDEDLGQKLHFKLLNDDNGNFLISSDGRLFKQKPSDYETTTTHHIEVEVTDNGVPILKTSKTFIVNVIDINEPPVKVDLIPSLPILKVANETITVPENISANTQLGSFELYDQDSVRNIQVRIENDFGKTFALSTENVTCQTTTDHGAKSKCTVGFILKKSVNFEAVNLYDIEIKIIDRGHVALYKYRVKISNCNDKPTGIYYTSNKKGAYIYENQEGGTIGLLRTVDEDKYQTYQYTVLNYVDMFEMIFNNLKFKNGKSADFEVKNSYVLNIKSTDSGNPPMSVIDQINITILDLNDAPSNVTLTNSIVNEDASVGAVIGSLVITDQDKPSPTASTHPCTVSSSSQFVIKNNILQVGSSLNFEKENITNLAISCTDKSIVTKWVLRIIIKDVNEAPTGIKINNNRVPENNAVPYLIATASTQDPDNGQTFKYQVLSNPSLYKFVGNKFYSYMRYDYEVMVSMQVEIEVTDSGSPSLSHKEIVTVYVNDVNDAPTDIVLSNDVIVENSAENAIIGIFQATDQDYLQAHKFRLMDSSDGRFKIVHGNQLWVAKSNKACLMQGGKYCKLNYEETPVLYINVVATDNGSPELSFSKNLTIYLNDVNDRPYNISISNYTLPENSPVDYIIGSLSASDEDKNTKVTFALIGGEKDHFYIDGYSNLRKRTNFSDFETKSTYNLIVEVSDNGSPVMKAQSNIIIEIIDVNEAPIETILTDENGQETFNVSNPHINENSNIGTVVGTIVSYDEDYAANLNLTLDDDSNSNFVLDSQIHCMNSTGKTKTVCKVKLLLNKVLNYEEKALHFVLVRSTDIGGLYHIQQFRITVLDVNDAPTDVLLSGKKTASFQENLVGAYIADLSAVDDDFGQSHSYEIVGKSKDYFEIKQNKLHVKPSDQIDYEMKSVYNVSIKCTDNGIPTKSITVDRTIYVLDVNEKPVYIGLSNNTIEENSPIGTIVGNINIADPDNFGTNKYNQYHNCTLTKGAIGLFIINSKPTQGGAGKQNYLVVADRIDYEKKKQNNITIVCHDSGTPTRKIQKEFTINIEDVNEKPIAITLSNYNVMENSIPGFVGMLSTDDPDNYGSSLNKQSFTYTLLNKTVPFIINGDKLRTTRKFDYELESSFNIFVRSRDNGTPSLSADLPIRIAVIDLNEPPQGLLLSNNTVKENSPRGTTIGMFSVIDEDRSKAGGKQQHTYSLIDNTLGVFRIAGNFLQVADDNKICLELGGKHCLINFETNGFMKIKVRVTDDGIPSKYIEKAFDIKVIDVNDKPYNLRLSSNTVPENASLGYAIGQFSVNDEDFNQKHIFSLADDNNGRFIINANNTLIKAKKTNYESEQSHKIIVTATDNGMPGITIQKEFYIVVQNINESPTNLLLTSLESSETFPDNQPIVKENQPSGTVVATVQADDQDAVTKLKFQLVQNPNLKFKLDDNITCVNLTTVKGNHTICKTNLLLNKSLNYEEQSNFLISIRVSDHAGLSHVASFNITVIDTNDAPTDVTVEGEHVVFAAENEIFKVIGSLETVDEDLNQVHTYKLKDKKDGKFFAIVKDNFGTYELNAVLLDYETQSNHSIIIISTDNGKPSKSFQQTILVQVLDLNEAPTAILLSSYMVNENTPIGTVVGNITVIDPDYGNTHSCRLMQNNKFKVANNILIVNGDLNYEKEKKQTVRITCSDSGFPRKSLEKNIDILINDVNESPTAITLTGTSVPENLANFFIGDFVVSDPDQTGYLFQTHNITITGTDLPFYVDWMSLKTSKSLNYEKKSSYFITVQATDDGGLSCSDNFTITVSDKNDPPTDVVCRGSFSIPEDSKAGLIIGTCTAVDEDTFQSHYYLLADVFGYGYGGNRTQLLYPYGFTIGSTTGQIQLANAKLDYELYHKYVLKIQSSDTGSPPLSVEKNVTIFITNVNQKPTDILLSNNKINENSDKGSVIGKFDIKDPDNKHTNVQNHTCTVKNIDHTTCPFQVNDIDELTVKYKQLLDYEHTPFIEITVTCVEVGQLGFSISKNYTISILNINEPPQNISLSPPTINEDNKILDVVGVIKFIDPDNLNSLTDTITVDKFITYGAPFKLQPPFTLVATQVLDYESRSSYVVQVTLKDDGKPSMSNTQNITIKVNDLNEVPADIILSPSTLHENIAPGLSVSVISTVDHDLGQKHIYKLLDDGGMFTVNGDQLILKGLLDYEQFKSVDILIQSTDDGIPPLTLQKAITINITDTNDKPQTIDATIIPVPENIKSEFKIANLHVNDEDANQVHTCECISNTQDWVRVVTETNGNISVFILPAKASIDYESLPSLFFEIRCSDNGIPKLWVETSLNVPVLDRNEAPTAILANNATVISIDENPIPGTVVGILDCHDPDDGQMFTYDLIGESKKYFEIYILSNELAITNLSRLNYEAPPGINQYSVSIKVTDNGQPPMSFNGSITVIAKDVNEAPSNLSLLHGSLDLNEDTARNTRLGQLWVDNPEGVRQRITFKVLNYVNVFSVVNTHAPASSSFITLIGDLNADIQTSYTVSIEAKDDGIPPLSIIGDLTFNVTAINPCVEKKIQCQKNAVCERVNRTHTQCVCSPGFKAKGGDCIKVDDCFPKCIYCIGKQQTSCNQSESEPCSPCQNKGICTDLHLDYSCACVQGFTGHDCSVDIDDCVSFPCGHNATCIDRVNNYTCVCDSGFRGPKCSIEIDECEKQPCFKGECQDLVNGFRCVCPQGYFGSTCERKTSDCSSTECKDTEICVQPDLSEVDEERKAICVSQEFFVFLQFPQKFASLEKNAAILWKLHFEKFMKDTVAIPLPWLQKGKDDVFKEVKMSDVMILSYELEKIKVNDKTKESDGQSRIRRDSTQNTQVKFFGAYKGEALAPNVLLFSVNETCEELYNDCTIKNNHFACNVCAVVNSHLNENSFLKRPITAKSKGDNDSPTVLTVLPIVGIVACVLLIVIVAVLVARNRRNAGRRKLDESEYYDGKYGGTNLEVMARRSESIVDNDFNNIEHFNPIYGINEEEVEDTVVPDNPLYDGLKPDDLFTDSKKTKNIISKKQGKMFENPVFGISGTEGTYEETNVDDNGIINPFYTDVGFQGDTDA